MCLIKSNFRLQEGKSKGKRLRLFEVVREGKVHTDEQAAQLLYKSKPNAAYSNLKQRVKQSVLNFILSKQINKKHSEITLSEARIDCWRLLTLAQILVRRKAYQEAVKVMAMTEDLIRRFDMKTERLVLEDLYQSDAYFSNRCGMNDFHNHMLGGYLLEVQFLIGAKAACNELEDYFAAGLELCDNRKDKTTEILENLAQMQGLDHNCVIGFWYHYLAALKARFSGALHQAVKHSEELVRVVSDFPQMFLDGESLCARLLLAELYLQQGKALAMEQELVKIENVASANVQQALHIVELRFKSAMHSLDFSSAEHHLAKGLKMSATHTGCATEAKWQFHSARFHFVQRKFKTGLAALNNALNGLPADSQFSVGARVLELLSLIESGSYELFEYRLEALHQFIKRQKKANHNAYRRIVAMLKLLVRFNYDFSMFNGAHRSQMELCSGDKTDANDQVLLDFDSWVNSKMRFADPVLVS